MITDELREYASSLAMRVVASTYEVKVALEEIADRIDREHEECAGFCRRMASADVGGEAGGRMIEYVTVWRDHEPTKLRWGVPVVRCKDCGRSAKGGTLCSFFSAYEPVAGGDEYEEQPAIVEPDGFCAWGEMRAKQPTLSDLYGVWKEEA